MAPLIFIISVSLALNLKAEKGVYHIMFYFCFNLINILLDEKNMKVFKCVNLLKLFKMYIILLDHCVIYYTD